MLPERSSVGRMEHYFAKKVSFWFGVLMMAVATLKSQVSAHHITSQLGRDVVHMNHIIFMLIKPLRDPFWLLDGSFVCIGWEYCLYWKRSLSTGTKYFITELSSPNISVINPYASKVGELSGAPLFPPQQIAPDIWFGRVFRPDVLLDSPQHLSRLGTSTRSTLAYNPQELGLCPCLKPSNHGTTRLLA